MSKNNSYGIKEVADTWFFPVGTQIKLQTNDKEAQLYAVKIGSDSYYVDGASAGVTMSDPWGSTISIVPAGTIDDLFSVTGVFNFDSLKVSNIEVASEETSAKGGKGNAELISWSYGKTITFTMTDALFSMQTLDLMFGAKDNIVNYNQGLGGDKSITIDANTFPDTYSIVGLTYMRAYVNGDDEPFVFYMPKAKVNVGGTLTMEAEGDPTTFEMTIKALSATVGTEDDVLIKFYKPTDTTNTEKSAGSLGFYTPTPSAE